MRSWVKTLWSAVRDSLWFVPGVFTLGAMLLAAGLMAAERHGLFWTGEAPWWTYQGAPRPPARC